MRRLWATVAVCLLAPAAAWAQDVGAPTGESAAAHSVTRVLLGRRTASGVALTVPSGTLEAIRFVPARTGRVRSLGIFLAAGTHAHRLALGLYSDRAGHPGALLTAATTTHLRARHWNEISVPARLIRARHGYWLAVLGTGGGLRIRSRARACSAQRAQPHVRRLPRWFRAARGSRPCLGALFAAGTLGSSRGGGSGGGGGGNGSGGGSTPTTKPVNVSPPVISGTTMVGDTLSSTRGGWKGDPTGFAYQWRDCTGSTCTNISGATSSSYLLRSSDVGHQIDVVVTASNAYGATAAISSATATVTQPSSAPGLHITGAQIRNASGTVIRLRGVDRAGTEYMCSEGYGIFDGPSGTSSTYTAMTAWKINTVFFGVNEDCWLAVNGVKAAYAGQNYITALKKEVALAEGKGLYPVIGFFWGDPGSQVPTGNDPNGGGQPPLPDNDHAPLLWEEIAETFKSDPNVAFRLQEEPHPSASGANASGASTGGGFGSNLYQWRCWSQGSVQYGTGSDSPTWGVAPKPTSSNHNCDEYATHGKTVYQTVGMQSLIDIIRGTGARNVIEVPGLAYANVLSCTPTTAPSSCGFLDASHGVEVHDTLSPAQLMADVDVYADAGQVCSSTSCYDTTFAPVAAQMPLGAGEVGPNGNTVTKTNQFLSWMDGQGESYDAWVWDTWGSLISNYNGAPDSPWGTAYKARLAG